MRRLLLGGSLIGAGLVVAGLAFRRCRSTEVHLPGGTCQTIYATQGIGSLLLGIGAASVAGGIVAVFCRGRNDKCRSPSLLAPGLLGLRCG